MAAVRWGRTTSTSGQRLWRDLHRNPDQGLDCALLTQDCGRSGIRVITSVAVGADLTMGRLSLAWPASAFVRAVLCFGAVIGKIQVIHCQSHGLMILAP
jgi:hypothetical protein